MEKVQKYPSRKQNICTKTSYNLEEEDMKMEGLEKCKRGHFVLIHGIGGGGWCWYKIRSLIENCGYKVTSLDLKGAGIDPSDPNTILSFHEYNKPLLDFLSSLPHNEQVILVGHSAGGMSVTDAIHKFPKKIKFAVYIAATMLRTGFMSQQDVKDGVPDLSEFGDVYDMEFGLGPEKPPTSVVVKKNLQREIIYQMSPLEDSTLASILLRPGPIQALQNAQFKEGEGVERVDRIYIRTTHDRVLKLEQQDAMIRRWKPQHVYTLESDHSPFFSAPLALFGLLVKVAASFD
ncbi:methylesterase 17-like [Solanum pennellii]|uniref:Methylesterase 17-like n=1 Tax=Solanum pennellii TaxID=28526 RepID=A0ABM1UYE1_SOLPN|nr:methylesterase 17-like [Solanum pennellii]